MQVCLYFMHAHLFLFVSIYPNNHQVFHLQVHIHISLPVLLLAMSISLHVHLFVWACETHVSLCQYKIVCINYKSVTCNEVFLHCWFFSLLLKGRIRVLLLSYYKVVFCFFLLFLIQSESCRIGYVSFNVILYFKYSKIIILVYFHCSRIFHTGFLLETTTKRKHKRQIPFWENDMTY